MHQTGPTIGIIGAGQLARMLIEAAIPLDLDIRILAADSTDGAARIWHHVTIGSPDDPEAVTRFAAGCDVVTFDHELVSESVLIALEQLGARLAPSAATLRIAQNKQRQRELFARIGLPQPCFRIAHTRHDAEQAGEAIGYPLVLKAAAGGYDGRGVWTCAAETNLTPVADQLAARGIAMITETLVPIERELAVMIARDMRGRITVLPTVETTQIAGICRQIVYEAEAEHVDATTLARSVAETVDLTGIMAVELFASEGHLLLNEIATRPHNSGHYSIEALTTSQFEQHLRAISGLAPGSTVPRTPVAATVNILGPADGSDPRDYLASLDCPDAKVHLYGKTARPGRKLGHVTVCGDDRAACVEMAWRAVEHLTREHRPEEIQ